MNTSHLPIRSGVAALVLTLSLFTASCTQPDPSARLKPLLDKYVQAWNTGDFTGLEGVVSSDCELRMSPRFNAVRGLDSLKINIVNTRRTYPDFHINLDEVIYAANAVTARWTIRATNSGPGEHPPTGKTVVVPGMSIIHVSAGKIVDEWVAANDLDWAQQLGFVLTPASPGK